MSNQSIKILIVDDEADIVEFLTYNLLKEGFVVFSASNGLDAIKQADEKIPEIIILDVMMPGMDGIEVCQELRSNSKLKNTFIVFLSARSEDYTQISGLDAGADGYFVKPIKPKLLVSRINSLLRRFEPEKKQEGKQIKIGGLIIDKERYIVIQNGKEIILPRKEFELLHLFATKPHKVFTRDEIFTKIWGDEVVVGERTIDVHIRKLREKIGENIIKTVKGVGYKIDL